MSKNNRNRQQQNGTVQAADTQKTAVDAKDDAAKNAAGDQAKAPTDTTTTATTDVSNAAGIAEAARLRAEQEHAEKDAEERARQEEAQRAEQNRREEAARKAEAADNVEVRVLRDGYFGAINDVVTIPRRLVEAAEADGAVCSNSASVAEAKSLARDD